MSSVPPQADLGQLLQNLQSPNNELRSGAEQLLMSEWVYGETERQSALLLNLAQLAAAGPESSRAFAAVLLRRYGIKLAPEAKTLDRLFDVISPVARAQIRQLLLQAMLSPDQQVQVRHKIADAVAEFARRQGEATEAWNELLPALFDASRTPNPEIRQCAFRVFAASPEILESNAEVLPEASKVLHAGFDDTSDNVRISAVTAFSAFFQLLPRSTWTIFKPMLPSLLRVMEPLRLQYKTEELTAVLESLIELVQLAPKMFIPVFKEVIEFSLAVAADKEMDQSTRLSAFEFVVSFADEAPNMCKAEPTYIEKLILQCLSMLVEVGEDDDDASEWNNEDDPQADEEDVHLAAKSSLDRMALKIGGEAMVPPLFYWLPKMLNSPEWRQRHGALMAISNVAEGCREVMITECGKLLDLILPLLADPHSRVQWAACNAIGQLSTDFAPEIQKKYGDRILPALISKLSNESTFRVQAHAAAAIVNFCEHASKEVMDGYLDDMLSRLLQLLQGPKRYVQEQVLTTIGVVADAAEQKFSKYYDTLMPLIFSIMKADTGNEYRLLKAKAIECSTLLAVAVGKEKFEPNFHETVQLFAAIQQQALDDDPCQSYLVQAWGRLCRIMGTSFLPYLAGVMPPLLAIAKTQADCHFLDEDQAALIDGNGGWEVIQASGQLVGIHTAPFDDKANAIALLSVYANELGADFYPYVPEILNDIALPSLSFFYHDDVRYSTCHLIPHLVTSAQHAASRTTGSEQAAKNAPQVLQTWLPCLEKMLRLIENDEAPAIVSEMFTAIYHCILLIGPDGLPAQAIEALMDAIIVSLTELQERLSARDAADNDEFIEDPEEEDAEQADEELIDSINKIIHAIVKTYKADALPQLDRIMPQVLAFLGSSNDDLREWALFVVNDIIEYTSPVADKYIEAIRVPMVESLVHSNARIRQAAVYGLGVAAQFGGDHFAQLSVGSLEQLFSLVNAPESRSEENLDATESAIGAIAKILRVHGDLLGNQRDMVITEWIKTLPIVEDGDAAPFAYLFLADLIGQKHPAVMQQVPKVFFAISQALVAGVLTGKRADRVVQATKNLLSQLQQNEPMELFNSLAPNDQAVIQRYFQ
ncbi:Importin subunit beta-3 [Wickerhamiella sorbophila]|uniref:Importin subunit beta-3 n=1 Tax=Wickerhamiella sorbophila TaxID=45607 RepID=A0A2T0FF83_9ASCO|nr:Importin subunit beta-3 [Wickerhamiella sorbophila]PRT53656.1 Importin subunit beta-3 [Wickerhamiella sorbophila]